MIKYRYMEEAGEAGDMGGGSADAQPEAPATSETLDASNTEDAESGTELSFEDWQKQEAAKASDPKEETEKPEEEKDAPDDKEEKKEEPSKEKWEQRDVEYTIEGQKYTAAAKDIPHMLSKVAAADRRFDDAANVRKEALEFVNFIKDNPIDAMKKAGIDFEKLAIDHVYDKYEYENMTDEQRSHHDQGKENKRLQADNDRLTHRDKIEKEQIQQQQEHEAHQKATQQAQDSLSKEIIDSLENSTVPRNKFTVSRMAQYMKEGLQKGYNLTASEVLQYVESDYAEMLEGARKSDVQQYKEDQVSERSDAEASKKPKKPGKRISSIYDLLD